MPLSPAAGCLSLAEQTLARTIASCAAFQELVGASDADDAARSIYFDGLPPPPRGESEHRRDDLEALRPFAIVFTDEQTGLRRRLHSGGTQFYFVDSGVLKFALEVSVSDSDRHDVAEAERKFKNVCGQIIDQMCLLAGRAGYLAITDLTFSGPFRCHPDQVAGEGDHQVGLFTIVFDNGA